MKPVQTTAYQTTDGQVFIDKRDAISHEILTVCHEMLSRNTVDTPNDLRILLIGNAEQLAPLLTEIVK
jgi:hypothetical protein